MDNKDSFNRVGIARNDEPTRFLTEEEMKQLEQARFNYENKTEDTVEKNNKIKIEDIAPKKKSKSSVWKKTQSFGEKLKNIVKKICIVASFVIVAILGFYLAFSWNMPIDRDKDKVVKNDIQQQTQIKDDGQDSDFKNLNNKLDSTIDEETNTFTKKINHAKQIVSDLDENINKDGSLKEKVVEVKTSAQGFVEDHGDELDILKYNLENLIDKILVL